MKEIGKERKIAITALIIAVLMLTVAFAAMSRTLKINGTAKVDSALWDIRFTSAEMKSKKGDAREAQEPVIDNGGIDLTLKVGLRKPKDEITYEAVIENLGDIDAEIESIEYPELNEDQAKIIEFIATYQNGDEISKSQELAAKEEKTVKIVIRYKDITDESLLAKEAYDIPLTFKINYIQKGFNTDDNPSGGTTQTEPAITVDENGMITSFNEEKLINEEGYVVVPATTETGEKIISIDSGSFIKHNVKYVDFRNDTTGASTYGYVILDEENYDAIEEILIADSGGIAASEFNNDVKPVNYKSNVSSNNSVQQMKVETGFGYTIYSKAEWDAYLKEAEGDDTYYHQMFYKYINLETKENEYPTVEIEKLDLSNAIYLTTIKEQAFSSSGTIKEVKLPSSLKQIEDGAFSYSSLEKIELPDGIEKIGHSAFKDTQIKSINFPSSIKETGRYMLAGITEFTKVEIDTEPSSIWKLISGNSREDYKIENLILGSNVKSFPLDFGDVLSLEIDNLTINMETISYSMFSPSENRKKVSIDKLVIGSNVKTIEYDYSDGAFQSLGISELVFEEGSNLIKIGGRAFDNNKISKVTIPSSVTTIEKEAFTNNPNLTEITIKRANSEGMILAEGWNGTATVKYDPN